MNKCYLLAGISVSIYTCFNTTGKKKSSTVRCDAKSRAEAVLTASNMTRFFETGLWL